MESPDASTWAPQSPDLSSYHSADVEPIHPQHQGYRGSISHTFTPSQSYQLNANLPPYSPPGSSPSLQNPASMPRGVKREAAMEDADYIPDAPESRVKAENGGGGSGSGGGSSLAGTEHIEVRTKFPVARIKRIMQADDDVGKVAQVTPVVVSKALELFMISLITKSATEAKARSSKRVNVAHLKSAVQKDEQFDFLSEIVSKIADAPAAADKHEDSLEVEGKKKKGGRRKKKEDDDF